MAHTGGGHPAGSLQVLAGDPDPQDKLKPELPDWMSIASHLRRDSRRSIPNYVAVNPIDNYDSFTIAGSTYLGPAAEPFKVFGDPSSPTFAVPNVGLKDERQLQVLNARASLKTSLDRLPRGVDQSGVMNAVDRIEQQALNLLTNPIARERSICSKNPMRFATATAAIAGASNSCSRGGWSSPASRSSPPALSGPLCGRVQNWDDHAVNQHMFDALRFRMPTLRPRCLALIEDIYARGLDKRVLVVVTGEFGRTPKISYDRSTGAGDASAPAGTVQPGRDHWPRAFSNIWAGGGIQTGGKSSARPTSAAKTSIERACGPGDFLATIYHHLGIDYKNAAVTNFAGRPVPIVDHGDAIPELAG